MLVNNRTLKNADFSEKIAFSIMFCGSEKIQRD